MSTTRLAGSRGRKRQWAAAASAGAVLALTVAHHLYGAAIYAAPFRRHALVVALPYAIVVGVLLWIGAARAGRPNARRLDVAAALLILLGPVLIIGVFEGGYNHLLKIVLVFGGAPLEVLHRLFPPPMYEMPGNLLFEVSGVLQAPLAAVAARDALRLLTRRRG